MKRKKKPRVYLLQFNDIIKIANWMDACYLQFPNLSLSLSNSQTLLMGKGQVNKMLRRFNENFYIHFIGNFL